jgi:hypothetical protein
LLLSLRQQFSVVGRPHTDRKRSTTNGWLTTNEWPQTSGQKRSKPGQHEATTRAFHHLRAVTYLELHPRDVTKLFPCESVPHLLQAPRSQQDSRPARANARPVQRWAIRVMHPVQGRPSVVKLGDSTSQHKPHKASSSFQRHGAAARGAEGAEGRLAASRWYALHCSWLACFLKANRSRVEGGLRRFFELPVR